MTPERGKRHPPGSRLVRLFWLTLGASVLAALLGLLWHLVPGMPPWVWIK